jgi:hypothetical protein
MILLGTGFYSLSSIENLLSVFELCNYTHLS